MADAAGQADDGLTAAVVTADREALLESALGAAQRQGDRGTDLAEFAERELVLLRRSKEKGSICYGRAFDLDFKERLLDIVNGEGRTMPAAKEVATAELQLVHACVQFGEVARWLVGWAGAWVRGCVVGGSVRDVTGKTKRFMPHRPQLARAEASVGYSAGAILLAAEAAARADQRAKAATQAAIEAAQKAAAVAERARDLMENRKAAVREAEAASATAAAAAAPASTSLRVAERVLSKPDAAPVRGWADNFITPTGKREAGCVKGWVLSLSLLLCALC